MSWVKPLKPTPGCIEIQNSSHVMLPCKKKKQKKEEEEDEKKKKKKKKKKEEEVVHGYNPTLVHGHHNTIYPQQ